MGKKSETNLINSENCMVNRLDFIELFDEQFSIKTFDTTIRKGEAKANSVMQKARLAIRDAYTNQSEEYHYEVSMSEDIKKAIESGEVNLVKGKDGLLYAQLRGEKGRFGSPLPIEKQLESQGVSAEQLEMAIQMEAIKHQLERMVETLKEIEENVDDIIQGQHNDRIGLFYSGLSLYAEAQNISNDELRTQVLGQALKALSDANSQIIQELRTHMEYLATERYLSSKRIAESIEEKLFGVRKCYDVIYRSTMLKAAIYFEANEMQAMLTSLDEYGRFIKQLIIPFAGMLSELDKGDKFIERGKWGKIADTMTVSQEMRLAISQKENMLISMEEE